jgi:hypothetical protein
MNTEFIKKEQAQTSEGFINSRRSYIISKWQWNKMEPRWFVPSTFFHVFFLEVVSNQLTQDWKNLETRTCGSKAQNTGEELLRSRVSTTPIFFFLIIDLMSALRVRLLPEYVCQFQPG